MTAAAQSAAVDFGCHGQFCGLTLSKLLCCAKEVSDGDDKQRCADQGRLSPICNARLFSIALVFGGFGIWASMAPLDRAAVASGQVAVESDHKAVQHLEGGIILEILAKETQQVKAGAVLFRLQPTQAQANTDIFRKQIDAALAEEARLSLSSPTPTPSCFPPACLHVAAYWKPQPPSPTRSGSSWNGEVRSPVRSIS